MGKPTPHEIVVINVVLGKSPGETLLRQQRDAYSSERYTCNFEGAADGPPKETNTEDAVNSGAAAGIPACQEQAPAAAPTAVKCVPASCSHEAPQHLVRP